MKTSLSWGVETVFPNTATCQYYYYYYYYHRITAWWGIHIWTISTNNGDNKLFVKLVTFDCDDANWSIDFAAYTLQLYIRHIIDRLCHTGLVLRAFWQTSPAPHSYSTFIRSLQIRTDSATRWQNKTRYEACVAKRTRVLITSAPDFRNRYRFSISLCLQEIHLLNISAKLLKQYSYHASQGTITGFSYGLHIFMQQFPPVSSSGASGRNVEAVRNTDSIWWCRTCQRYFMGLS